MGPYRAEYFHIRTEFRSLCGAVIDCKSAGRYNNKLHRPSVPSEIYSQLPRSRSANVLGCWLSDTIVITRRQFLSVPGGTQLRMTHLQSHSLCRGAGLFNPSNQPIWRKGPRAGTRMTFYRKRRLAPSVLSMGHRRQYLFRGFCVNCSLWKETHKLTLFRV